MRKPTVNQMKWQAILNQTQKALAEITKVTGEIFDEAELRPERPQRITEKKLAQLKETQLDFIHKQVEDVIKNMRTPEAEELAHKVRTKEQYIRHPRISKGKKEYEQHPLTASQRSERAKKAWQTRLSRMTPEEREQYGKDFAERMKKAREAKELERKGYEAPPEAEEPVTEKDWDEVLGEPLTPEEVQELDYAKQLQKQYIPDVSAIIDAQIAHLIETSDYPERTNIVLQLIKEAKERLGVTGYYALLERYGEEILNETERWLNYRDMRRARTSLDILEYIFAQNAMDLQTAIERANEYDTELDDIE